MDDLTAFMAARYDEAEATAKAILEDPDYAAEWHEQSSGVLYVGPGSEKYPMDGLQPMGDSRLARHIAACDPAHRLADIALKRAILAAHSGVHDCPITTIAHHPEKGEWPYTSSEHVSPDDGDPYWPCTTARQLGTEFAGHAGYRTEWAPPEGEPDDT